ncbi:MAG: hypothetical protein RLY14_2045, partial [Planctomycetota bacterium]
ESEEEKTLSGDSDSKDKIFEKNFYTDEILNVTRDYVDALAEQKQVRAG